jgi:protease stability complex PrcB-like protein
LPFGIPGIAAVPRPALAVIVLAVGLSGAFLVYGRVTSSHQTVISFQTIPTTGAPGYSQSVNLVINDNDTWVKVWKQAFWEQPYCSQPRPLGGYPCEPAPSINFTTRTVIAVFMGEQPNPGYTIKITQIVQSGSNVVVHLLSTNAGGCVYATEEVWPAYIADIPKTNAHLTFSTDTITCGNK